MRYKNCLRRFGIWIFVAVLLGTFVACKNQSQGSELTTAETTLAPTTPTESTTESTQPTVQTSKSFTLSFAGDCTLGTSHDTYGQSGTFVKIVGKDYNYPFKSALEYFANDDFTMVNLEGTLTEHTIPAEKRFRFRGPISYSKILTAGSVEAVNLANNHTFDFGNTGYADTKKALENEKITYVEDQKTAYYNTESGLRIGIYAAYSEVDTSKIATAIKELRKNGAELIIASFHWGVEGSYRPTQDQKDYAHAAIDAGANIVYGHHPHVLQPIETYKDGVIYYSLGNFSFGGNRNPRDKDTAVIQQTVVREADGSVRLGETTIVPFSQSSVSSKNDYQPTPYRVTNSKYKRVLSKLDGTFTGKDLVVDYNSPQSGSQVTQPTTSATTAPPSVQEGTTGSTTASTTSPTTASTTSPTTGSTTASTTSPTTGSTTSTTSPTTTPTTKPTPKPTDDEWHIPN